MPTWGLIVETTVGIGQRKRTETYVLAHMTGDREEAMAELERRAKVAQPEHPRTRRRRRLFRHGDGFLLVLDGSWESYSSRFTLAELLEDSDAPAPEPVPQPEDDPTGRWLASEPLAGDGPGEGDGAGGGTGAGAAPELDEDGIPVKPSWLGRTDIS